MRSTILSQIDGNRTATPPQSYPASLPCPLFWLSCFLALGGRISCLDGHTTKAFVSRITLRLGELRLHSISAIDDFPKMVIRIPAVRMRKRNWSSTFCTTASERQGTCSHVGWGLFLGRISSSSLSHWT